MVSPRARTGTGTIHLRQCRSVVSSWFWDGGFAREVFNGPLNRKSPILSGIADSRNVHKAFFSPHVKQKNVLVDRRIMFQWKTEK